MKIPYNSVILIEKITQLSEKNGKYINQHMPLYFTVCLQHLMCYMDTMIIENIVVILRLTNCTVLIPKICV